MSNRITPRTLIQKDIQQSQQTLFLTQFWARTLFELLLGSTYEH